MKYTVFEQDSGRILRRYELHDEDEIALNTGSGEGFVEGDYGPETHYVPGGVPVPFPPRPGPLWEWDYAAAEWSDASAERVPELRADARKAVNAAADAERGRMMTPITGQGAVYAMKREEAAAFLSDGDPDLSNFPLISAEIGITGETAFEVAQVFLNLNALTVSALAGIEARRMTALAAVAAAQDAAGIDEAVAGFSA